MKLHRGFVSAKFGINVIDLDVNMRIFMLNGLILYEQS